MPIKPIDARDTEGAFDAVHRTLATRSAAAAFSLPKLSKADPGSLAIAMPHRVQSLAFADIRRGMMPRKEKTDCWRFLVLEGHEPIAAATAVRTGTDDFEFGGLDEGPFVAGTEQAILRAEARLEGRAEEFEAVLLLVPAAYVVALWLQHPSSHPPDGEPGEADLLLAVPPSNPALDPTGAMTSASFLEALRRAQ